MTPNLESILDKAVAALKTSLGENLYSCCLYGSAVRGNFVEGISDINLLIVLKESNPAAHEAVAKAIGKATQIDPFILGRRGFERSARAFATKFASITRNYRVLHGADPLSGLKLDPPLERFLCEQALRNLRLRLIYAFVTRQRNKGYDRFLVRNVAGIFVQLCEVLRLEGIAIPLQLDARIPLLQKEFGMDGEVLRELLALKSSPRRLSEAEMVVWHERIFEQFELVLKWIENKWPM